MGSAQDIKVPDIGDFEEVEVIEVLVAPGDAVIAEDPLITLESDKAAIDVPSPETGKVETIKVKVGDKVSEGSVILTLSPAQAGAAPVEPSSLAGPEPATESAPPVAANDPPLMHEEVTTAPKAVPAPPSTLPPPVQRAGDALPHASPSVRRFARELGVDL
ncbi:MAG: biotin/lipoyl-containing protein, partial [Gammaproteobacteria bacterium]